MRPQELTSFLTKAIEHNFPILIKGKPGIGKTDIVTQAAKAMDADLIIAHPVVSDPTDFKGLPFQIEGEAQFLPYGELKLLLNAKKKTVYFLDDLGQAPPAVQAAVMQLLLARQINGKKISDHVTFVAATNRREDRAGVVGLLEPVKSRFTSIVQLEVNNDDWCEWANQNNVPDELIAFIRWRTNVLNDGKPTKDIENTPSPRTVYNLGKLQKAGLHPVKGESKERGMVFHAYAGAVGEATAAEYCAFLDLRYELPSFEEIIKNPKKAPVPTQANIQFALTSVLSKADADTMDQMVIYLDRIPAEYQVMVLKNLKAKNKDFLMHPALKPRLSKLAQVAQLK